MPLESGAALPDGVALVPHRKEHVKRAREQGTATDVI